MLQRFYKFVVIEVVAHAVQLLFKLVTAYHIIACYTVAIYYH